jgi:hypothetical protein
VGSKDVDLLSVQSSQDIAEQKARYWWLPHAITEFKKNIND